MAKDERFREGLSAESPTKSGEPNPFVHKKGKKMEKLSDKEQEVYDYVKSFYGRAVGDDKLTFEKVTGIFGEKVTGTLGKLKQLNLIDITKNCRVKSTYGTKFPKVIVLKEKKDER